MKVSELRNIIKDYNNDDCCHNGGCLYDTTEGGTGENAGPTVGTTS